MDSRYPRLQSSCRGILICKQYVHIFVHVYEVVVVDLESAKIGSEDSGIVRCYVVGCYYVA